MSRKLDEALRAAGIGFQAHMEREMLKVLSGATTTNTIAAKPPRTLTPAYMQEMLRECEKIQCNMRRTQVTVTVDAAHEGPALQHTHPHDGLFIECSPLQAREMHRTIPLKLAEVENEWRATFRPAISAGIMREFAPVSFLMPPWDLPPDEPPALSTTPADR